MPSGANSMARPSERPVTANLLAEYAASSGWPMRPATEDMLMIQPRPWRRMVGSAALIVKTTPR